MNKTRMGKRVASLLLSLVMMLSLLPTAAYAAMGYDVDTQGASVSENGTGESDDDNSGGSTGAQQVGDSEDGGTADDTTGAEGGNDITGAEGGNDTTGAEGGADPTGSVNATTTYVAYIGEVGYETLDAAITAAGDGETVVVSEGEYTLNGSLTYTDKAITVKAADGAKVTFDMSKAVALHGAKITFESVTFTYTNADYTGLQHTDTVVYNNCTINGKMFLYANSETFNDCHFVQKSEDYNVWTYGAKKVAFNNCTFDCVGKAVNVYIEKGNASDDAKTIEVNNCTVNSTKAEKAFLNIKNSTQAYDVTLSGTNTVTGLANDGTTGSALYQVETTKVTETTGNPVTVKQENTAGELETVYEVKETVAETPMDLDAFIKAVVASGYNYDGNGVTVKWSPATGCYDTREGHTCTAGNVTATGNTPKRVNSGLTQFQLFEGQSDAVTVKNVNFVYEPAAFTVCENSGWKGSFTAEQAPAGQLYFMTSGDVNFEGCTFEKVVLTSFNTAGTTTVKNCTFRDVYNSYAIKDVRGATVSVTGTTIENCGGGIMVSSTNKVTDLTITGNTFTNVDTATTAPADKAGTRALLQIANSGDYSAASYDLSNNTASSCGPVLRQLNTTAASGVAAQEAQLKSLTAEGGASGLYTSDTVKTYVAAIGDTKYASLQAAIDAATEKATVILLADTRENVTISTNRLTLDLNGHTLNGGTVAGKPALTVRARNVIVKDSSEAKTGTIMREDTAENSGVSSHYVIDIQGKGAFLTFESGNVKNNSGNKKGNGASLVRVGDDSVSAWPQLTIAGGTFTQDNFIVIKVDRGTFYLTGGTLNSKNDYAVENWYTAIIKGGTVNGEVAAWTYSGGLNSDLTISDNGIVNGDVASVSYDKAEGKVAKVSITGGTVTGTLGTYTYDSNSGNFVATTDATKATIAVTGGTFSKDPTKYVVEDSAITPNADGTYGVAKAYLAKVGDTSYYTMEEAFKAQTANGEAIVLLRDYTTGSTFNSGSINRTVDLDGHTWTCTGTDANSAAFEINYSDASLTVKNGKVVSSQLVGLIPSAMGGTIKYDNSTLVFDGVEMTTTARSGIETNGNNTNDTVTLRNSTLNVPNGYGIYFPSSGTLTIDNSKINAKTMGVQVCSGSLNVTGAGTAITVSGDGIEKTGNDGAIEDGAAISIVERTGYKGLSEIKVSGGTFTANGTNDAVKAYKWENQTASGFTQDDKVSVSGGTFSSAVDKSLCAEGFIPTDNGNGTYGVKEGKYVAEIGSQGYESLQAAIDAAKSGATVKLLADTRENVTIAKKLTLDLNGFTLNGGTVKGTPALKVDNCSVTVKDSSAEQTGTIKREDTADNSGVSSHYVIDIQGKNGFLKFEGGNVVNNSGNTAGKGASLIRLGNDSVSGWPTLTIKGGTFTQDNFIAIKVDRGTLHLLGGTVNSANSFAIENWNNAYIKGGTVNGTVSTWVYSTGAAFSKLTISGGTVNGNVASVNYDNAADKQARVYVTGGTVTGTLGTYTYKNGLVAMDETAKATIEVTGGTFKEDPTQYVVEGSAINKNDDGTFGVAKAYLAKVGETSYYTMDEAFHAAVASGETLTLLRDYTTGSSQNSGSNSFTIDLNGFTWTYTGKDVDCAAFEINYSDVTLTVKNGKVVSSQLAGLIPSAMSGTITYDNSGLVFENVEMTANGHSGIETNGSNTNDTVTLRNSTLNVPNGYGIYFPSSGTLTIDNSKINAKTMGVQVCSGSLNVTGAGTAITVSGDGIEKTGNDGAIEDGAAISIVERTGYKGLSAIKVESGTFTANGTNAAVKAYKWENQTESDFTQAAKVFVSGGTFSSAVDKSLCADGFIPTDNGDGTYGVKEGKYVAEIGSQGYESLQEAINAAQDGQTVTLLADVTADVVINKSITLDLGGKILTNTNAGKATISVQSGTVTVKNGNVVGGTGYYNIEVTKNSGADLTLTDVTATAGNTGSSMIDNWGTLTITSGTYTGGLNVVKSEEDSVLNISGGTFTLSYATSGYTGVIFVYGDTTISGGEFIQSLTTTGRWNHPQVIATGVVEGYTAITRVTGGHFVNKMSGEGIFRGIGNGTSDNFEVSGGTFNKSISDGYFKEGYFAKKTNNGYEADGPYAVRIGTTAGYATLGAAIEAINSGATTSTTITLLQDLTESVVISKNTTIDLNGKTLTNNGAANTIQVNGGKLTVKDSSAKKLAVDSNTKTVTYTSGKIVNNQPRSAQCVAVKVNAGASFVLTSGTLESQHNYALNVAGENANATVNGGYIVGPEGAIGVFDKAQLTVKNGVMLGTDNAAIAGNGNAGNGDTTITISGGTIIGRIESAGYIACGIYHPQSGTLKISGGTIYAVNGVGILMRAGVLNMTGGKIVSSGNVSGRVGDANVITTCYGVYVDGSANYSGAKDAEFGAKISGTASITADAGVSVLNLSNSNATNGTIGVSGGTFSTAVPADYCADGFIPTQNEDGTYGVKEGKFVAEVGSKKYESLADAVAAAEDGKTITLLADVEQNTQLTINKSITLDLNGKTIKNTVDIWGDNANAILSITNGAKVTITGNGTIDAKENDCYTINVVKGDLTIENGIFYGNVSVVQVQEGTLSVKGGTFDLHQKWEGSSKYLFNCIDDAYMGGSAKVAISGGTFVGFDPNVSPEQKVDGKVPSFAAPGAGITKNEDGSFTAAAGMTAQILDKDGNSVKAYESLAEAVAAAQDGQTVRLLADVEQNTQLSIDKSITLDLNGKTIKISGYTAEKAQVSVKGNLTIQDSSEAQTGKICSDYTGTAGRVVSVENGGKLTIAGGTITTEGMSNSGSAVYIASGAEVNMTGGTVKVDAKRGNAAMNVKGSTGVFTMSGGSVIAEAGDGTETDITAISGISGSTIQISAGTVSGPQALFARSSATTITGGNFTGSITVKNGSISGGTFDRALDKNACAAGYVPADNGNGTYGVAVGKFTVKVTSRTTGSDSPVANVAGGGSDITYAEGTTVTASAISGYNFVGWFVNEYTGTAYSTALTCEVKPTDDCTMIAVYEPISGGKFWLTVTASEFTVNGGAVQDSYLYEQFAVGASVTVNFTGSENFLYWVNASNKVVSTDKSYSFIMGSETTLKAVYGKARQNQATVVFISHSDQIISSKAYTTSDTIQFPVPPIKMGCTFTGWSMTEEQIRAAMANNSGIIQVRALYTEPSIACKVTVVYPEGTDNQVVNAVVGKAIDVTAKDIEGKTFSYWTDNDGNILGYTKTLKLAPSGDMTVKAVYGENAEVKPVISMTAIDASAGNGYYVISFTATRAVPESYELVKQGVLYSANSRCAGDAGKDYLKLTADGTVPEGVYEFIGNNNDLNGVTRVNGKVLTADTTLYGRGYMILKNSAGEVMYVYTDTILSGSYNSLTTNGGN